MALTGSSKITGFPAFGPRPRLPVAGKGFNWPHPDHFRIVFLPTVEDLKESLGRLQRFLKDYKQ